MPRSCRSGDMAGTFMLYHPGTDGAAVTDVRLHGSRSSQHPESRDTRCVREQTDPALIYRSGADMELTRSFTADQFARALESWDWAGIQVKQPLFTWPFG